MKTRNVTFVCTDDPEYRAHRAYHAQANRSLRDTLDPSPLQKLSWAMETVFRAWLAQHISLLNRRILRYEYLKRSGQYRVCFKEIDAIETAGPESDRPVRLFEMKCSTNATSLSSAGSQLMKAIRPLRCRWRGIYRHAVLVAVLPDQMDLPEPIPPLDCGLPHSTNADPSRRITTCLDAQALWQWGQDTGALEAPFGLLDEAQEEAEATIERRRQRRALKQKGVPKSKWPEHVKPTAPEVPETKTATYGDTTPSVSSLGAALQDALNVTDE